MMIQVRLRPSTRWSVRWFAAVAARAAARRSLLVSPRCLLMPALPLGLDFIFPFAGRARLQGISTPTAVPPVTTTPAIPLPFLSKGFLSLGHPDSNQDYRVQRPVGCQLPYAPKNQGGRDGGVPRTDPPLPRAAYRS